MNTKIVTGLLAGLSMLAYGAPWAEEEEETPTPATIEELESAIADLIEEHEVPAIGIAMVDENGPVFAYSDRQDGLGGWYRRGY
jgi:hypothetical protein